MEEKMIHFNRIRRRLIELARDGSVITYGVLERECNIPNGNPGEPNHYLFDLLYDLGSFEALFDRPPINALVVRSREKTPGQGFYNWVKLRLKLFDVKDQVGILGKFMVKCSQYWSDEEKYRLFSGPISIDYKKE
jgi:hypothetical protein